MIFYVVIIMGLNRNEARIKAMTILYQKSLYDKNKISYDINSIIDENMEEKDDFVIELVNGVNDNIDKLDSIANKYLGSWPINRLGLTDANIIRGAIYEMLYTNTDGKIVINEAIEISKKFSDESVTNIINGVLDKVYHNEI